MRIANYLYENAAMEVSGNDIKNPQVHRDPRYGISIVDCNHPFKSVSVKKNTFMYTNQTIEVYGSGKGGGRNRWVELRYNNISYSKGYGKIFQGGEWKPVWNYTVSLISSNVTMLGDKNWSVWKADPRGIEVGGYSNMTLKVHVYMERTKANVLGLVCSSFVTGTILIENSVVKTLLPADDGGWGYLVSLSGTDITLGNSTVQAVYPAKDISVGGANTNVIIRENNITGRHYIPGSWFQMPNYGIVIEGGSVQILNNTRIVGYDSAIVVNGGVVEVSNNKNVTFYYRGIRLNGGTSDITSNVIHSAKNAIGTGVYVGSSAQATISEGNEICNAEYGIQVLTPTPPDIFDSNEIHNNTYGVYVQGGNVTVRDHNVVHNNDYGIYINTNYAPYIHDNNTIENNSIAGIWIGKNVGTFGKQIWWNDILGNGIGIEVESDVGEGNYFHCECNWWGGTNDTPPYNKGPYDPSPGDPDINTYGTGQYVSDYFWYRNETANLWWLLEPGNQATSCAPPP